MDGSITKIKAEIETLKAKLEQLRGGKAFAISLGAPFTKVSDDEGDWTVEGPVTAEVVDAQNEIITYPAAKAAFAEWQGNIRSMHSMDACGKALAVTPDDTKKLVMLKAMVSKGSPEVWRKINEGVLRGFSLGGTRLRSQVREDGIRVTSALKIAEVSFVDAPACPRAYFCIVKVSGGVPRITEILASDGEERMACAAVAVERVATILAVSARPSPTEVSCALAELAKAAGTPAVSCDSTQTRDFAVEGPMWARQLRSLAQGLKASPGDATTQVRIAKAAELVLLEFVHKGRRATCQLVSASKLYDSAAAVLAKTMAAPSSRQTEAYDSLAASIFKLADMRRAEGVEVKGPVTLDELREMESKLTKSLSEWNKNRLPQNGKEYEILSRAYMKVAAMRKRAEGFAVRLGRV